MPNAFLWRTPSPDDDAMRRCRRGLSLTLGLAATFLAPAQTQAQPAYPSGGRNPSSTVRPSSAAANPDAGYQDKVIDGLQPLADENAAPPGYNPDGWARQMRVETQLSRNAYTGNTNTSSAGVGLYGLIETPNHGVLSVDAQLGGNPGGGLVTLRQRGLPFGSGWSVSNEVGVIGSPAPALARAASRVAVPGYLMLGGSTDWSNAGQGLRLQGSAGSPGRLDGALIGRFQRLPGSVSSLGAEVDRGPWSLAARVADASGASYYDNNPAQTSVIDASSAQFSLRHATPGRSLQANVIATSDQLLGTTPAGLWVDTEARIGPRSFSGGFFWLEPGLSWAGVPMANDVSGAYVRSTWQSRQWSVDGTLDVLRSIAQPTGTGIFMTGNARWRYSSRISMGAGAAVRRFNGNAWNGYTELRWLNDWGSTSLRADISQELEQSRSRQLTLDHDWNMSTGWSLATSVTGGRVVTLGVQETLVGAAVSINAPVTSQLSVRANASANSSEGGDAGRFGTAINTGVSWRFAPEWSLEANYNLNKGKTRFNAPIDPLAPPLVFDTATSGNSLFVALRWNARAGSGSDPLGGTRAQGGARIVGTVFFDANNNGRQEASETGAPGVTVYLDNRYTARTDAQGRFDFPFVGTGLRVISVQNDTLPLPWTAPGDGRVKLELLLREDQRVNFGVVRDGDS